MSTQNQSKLTEEQKREYQDCFCMFVREEAGYLNRKHLKDVFKMLGFNTTDETLQIKEFEVDYNNKGRINFQEFLELIETLHNTKEELKAARDSFNSFDFMGKGYIEAKDLKETFLYILESSSEEEKEELIQYYRLKKNRKIFFPEFKTMIIPAGMLNEIERNAKQKKPK